MKTWHKLTPHNLILLPTPLRTLLNSMPYIHPPYPIHLLKSKTRSVSLMGDWSPKLLGTALCTVFLHEDKYEHQQKKPLLKLQKVGDKDVCNQENFKGAPIMTTFIWLASSHTNQVLNQNWIKYKAGGVGVPFTQKSCQFLFREGPHLRLLLPL